MDPSSPTVRTVEGTLRADGLRVALIVARFNGVVTERLLAGAIDALVRHGAAHADLLVVRVPGAFELPAAAAAAAARADVDAVVALGCLVRGDTIHFDLIAAEATRGLAELARTCGKPVTFGVLTADTMEQAVDRAGGKAGNKGAEAAMGAVEMAAVLRALARDAGA